MDGNRKGGKTGIIIALLVIVFLIGGFLYAESRDRGGEPNIPIGGDWEMAQGDWLSPLPQGEPEDPQSNDATDSIVNGSSENPAATAPAAEVNKPASSGGGGGSTSTGSSSSGGSSPSSNGGSNSNTGSSGSSSGESSHTHNWAQRFVKTGQHWVVDRPEHDERTQVGSIVRCNSCGAEFSAASDWVAHSKETNCGSYSVVPVYETVHVPEQGHYVDDGYTETYCTECGAIK
ncbi:MAG: hypothetical protein IJH83_09380 [Coriobacteriales bacterium]|nr:hypothetical protein [Coriobacteriales bacterium]